MEYRIEITFPYLETIRFRTADDFDEVAEEWSGAVNLTVGKVTGLGECGVSTCFSGETGNVDWLAFTHGRLPADTVRFEVEVRRMAEAAPFQAIPFWPDVGGVIQLAGESLCFPPAPAMVVAETICGTLVAIDAAGNKSRGRESCA